MGFTRYWIRTKKKINKDFVVKVCEIIADCDEKGITIRNWCGEGNPVVTLERISLNGNSEHQLDHESFVIDKEVGLNFCKTARKPYDYAVREILKYAEENGFVTEVEEDDENNEVISDTEYLKRYRR